MATGDSDHDYDDDDDDDDDDDAKYPSREPQQRFVFNAAR